MSWLSSSLIAIYARVRSLHLFLKHPLLKALLRNELVVLSSEVGNSLWSLPAIVVG